MQTKTHIHQSIIDHAMIKLEQMISDERIIYTGDLHHELFNTDYFLIGYYACREWLNEVTGNDVFRAIERIIEYEKENFGEITMKLVNSETTANMYAYILGEELLYSLKSYSRITREKLRTEDLQRILDELKAL